MIVALGGIGEQRVCRDIAIRSCLIRAGPAIGHSVEAEDIVEPDNRRALAEGITVESVLPGFCDYYVIGQFRLLVETTGIDAGTV
jgi:hypothetical protein